MPTHSQQLKSSLIVINSTIIAVDFCFLFQDARSNTITSSCTPTLFSQFQPSLAQNIVRLREFKFVQMKGHALFQRMIITKLGKYIDEIWKPSSPEPRG